MLKIIPALVLHILIEMSDYTSKHIIFSITLNLQTCMFVEVKPS